MDKKHLALYILGSLILALLIFHAGIAVGSRHRFSDRREPPPFMGLPHGFIEAGHGALGTVGSIATSSLTLTTREGGSETVLLTASTSVRTGASATSSGALKEGARVIVLGTRDASGKLVADVIHIFSR